VLSRFREPVEEVAALIGATADEAERVINQIATSPLTPGAEAEDVSGT
jgi:hypothetical protein